MTGQEASLQQTFEALHAVLRGAAAPESAQAALGLDSSRVAFYADTVFEHVQDILHKNYAVLAELLGAERFETLVREYYALHPAEAFELNENAAPFREFLAEQRVSGRLGLTEAHLELAELEWQEFVAYVSPAQIPERRWLSSPELNPTLIVLQLDYPVAGFLDAWREWEGRGEPPTFPTEPDPETVFVLRHPESENALFVVATDALLFALKVVHEGVDVDQAAEATGAPREVALAALREARDWGLVLWPEATTDVIRLDENGEPQPSTEGE